MDIFNALIRALLSLFGLSITPAERDAKLDQLARANRERLDWRNSIVDLMKLTNQDSSLENRKAMARELGYTGPLDGSGSMNMWLHARVMERLLRRGAL